MITENVTTLNIHKLTQEQYNRELLAGNIDENAIYLTTDDSQEQIENISEALNTIQEELDDKADKSTSLSGYGITDAYTKAQVDSALSGKAASSHNHDDRYYTESEMDTKLSGKANASHTHDAANIGLTINDPTSTLTDESNVYEALITFDEVINDIDGNISSVRNKADTVGSDLDIHIANKNNPHGVTAEQVGAYTKAEVDSALSGKANTSHGNHVPATETANNAKFLRNDNTWATVTPANIGAAASSHNHSASEITSGTLGVARGGTGKATHTANAVLTGNGTSAVNNVATASGAFYATAANGAAKFGTLPISQGGTGSTSASAARNALGITPANIGAATQSALDSLSSTVSTQAATITSLTNRIAALEALVVSISNADIDNICGANIASVEGAEF